MSENEVLKINHLPFAVSPLVQGASEDHHIGNEDAHSYPALGPVGATPELYGALDDTDPPFNSIAEALAFLEPVLFFKGGALRGAVLSRSK